MACGVYTITNVINNKMYVGHSKAIQKRWGEHKSTLKRNTHENSKLQRAWNKYGEENFLFEILVECELKDVYSEEHYWCNLLNVHDDRYGYNIRYTNPEDKGSMFNADSRKLMSEIQKKVWANNPQRGVEQSKRMKGKQYGIGHIITPEDRIKINEGKKSAYYSQEARKGMGHMKNKTHTKEARKKISEANQGRKKTQKQIDSIRERSIGNAWNIGRECSEETRKKISNTHKKRTNKEGYVHPNTGKKLSKETVAKIIAANTGRKLPNAINVNRKAVICYNENDTEYRKFKSLTEAVEHFGSHYKQGVKLSRAIKINKRWKNKKWQYENTDN